MPLVRVTFVERLFSTEQKHPSASKAYPTTWFSLRLSSFAQPTVSS